VSAEPEFFVVVWANPVTFTPESGQVGWVENIFPSFPIMKRLFTLAAATTLAAASLSAQAQAPITIDGQITPAEIATGGYTLVGTYTGTRGFSPNNMTDQAGLLSLYAAADANNVYFFLAGTLETDKGNGNIKNSLQIFVDRPGISGVPVGTKLPVPAAATAPAVNTSFEKFAPFLDLPADMGIAIKGNGQAGQIQVEGIVYAGGTTPTANATVLSGSMGIATTGAVAAVTGQTGVFTIFNGAQVAYRTSVSLNTNPGFASNGQIPPANGLEVAVSRASIGLAANGGPVLVFALQNNGNGDFASSDFIPQNSGPLPASFTNAPNLGGNPDFRLVPGTQAATVNVGAGTGVTVLATKAADAAAIGLSIYPNPSEGASTVQYAVTERAANVNIVLTDLVGRSVRVLENSIKAVGTQRTPLNTSNLAAGSYLVRVQVGERVSTSKVSVL